MTAAEPGHPAEHLAASVTLREVAEEVAAISSAYLLEHFRAPMAVAAKGSPHDLVTEHDLESERIIRAALLAAVPGSTVVGEESGASTDAPISGPAAGTTPGEGARVTWHVDPIDGTVNFAHGIAFWCVSIAAAIDGEVVAGVIAAPALGEVFAADLTGVTVNGEPARPRRLERELDSLLVSTFPRGIDLVTNGDAALTAGGELVRAYGAHRTLGSGALGLAHVATGRADATFDLHTNTWDVAAGALMVRLGGGRYFGCAAGELDTDPLTAWQQPAYLATASDIEHPTLTRVVTELTSPAALL